VRHTPWHCCTHALHILSLASHPPTSHIAHALVSNTMHRQTSIFRSHPPTPATLVCHTHFLTFMLPLVHSNSVVSRTCLSLHHTRSQSAALISLVELYACISHEHFTRISLTSLRKHLLADLLHSVSYAAYANHASPVTPANYYTDTHLLH
jgi:hypothetical protein